MKLKRLLLPALIASASASVVLADPPATVKEAAETTKPAPTSEVKTEGKVAVAPPAPPAPPLDPAVMKTNSSYGFGFRAGREFGNQTARFGITEKDIDREAFVKALFEAFTGKDASVPEEDVNAAFVALQKAVQEREAALGEKNLAAGLKFLEENGKRKEITTTASGLQYEILTKGEGETYKAPSEASQAPDRTQFMVQYKGTLIDGSEFDASKGKAVPMGLNTVPGFKEALTTMPIGSTWKVFLKPELAYGPARRSPQIGPNSTLIFELTLEEIKEAPAPPAQPQRTPGRRPTAVSPPVRVPLPPQKEGASAPKKATVVSPPVRVTTPQKEDAKAPEKEAK